jgi:hypothetical protein
VVPAAAAPAPCVPACTEAVVSFAVAMFSLLLEPWCEATEPADPVVSI